MQKYLKKTNIIEIITYQKTFLRISDILTTTAALTLNYSLVLGNKS